MSHESSTPAQLRAFFEQHEIHTVETAVADSRGHLRGKCVPVRRFFDTVIEKDFRGGSHRGGQREVLLDPLATRIRSLEIIARPACICVLFQF